MAIPGASGRNRSLRHPCYRPAPLGLQTCTIHPTDLHHRLPVSVPNVARGRVAPSLSWRKRAGAGRLTVQLVFLRALRPVTSSNNVRHARLRSVRPDDWRHRPSVSHPGTAPCTIPTRMPVSANSLRRSPFPFLFFGLLPSLTFRMKSAGGQVARSQLFTENPRLQKRRGLLRCGWWSMR